MTYTDAPPNSIISAHIAAHQPGRHVRTNDGAFCESLGSTDYARPDDPAHLPTKPTPLAAAHGPAHVGAFAAAHGT